jgi:hypothetical protein
MPIASHPLGSCLLYSPVIIALTPGCAHLVLCCHQLMVSLHAHEHSAASQEAPVQTWQATTASNLPLMSAKPVELQPAPAPGTVGVRYA